MEARKTSSLPVPKPEPIDTKEHKRALDTAQAILRTVPALDPLPANNCERVTEAIEKGSMVVPLGQRDLVRKLTLMLAASSSRAWSPPVDVDSWDYNRLREHFFTACGCTSVVRIETLKRSKQSPKETTVSFIETWQRSLTRIDPEASLMQAPYRPYVLAGLRHKDLALWEAKNYAQLLSAAQAVDDRTLSQQALHVPDPLSHPSPQVLVARASDAAATAAEEGQEEGPVESVLRAAGPPQRGRGGRGARGQGRGRGRGRGQEPVARSHAEAQRMKACWTCGQQGHFSRHCSRWSDLQKNA